MHTFIKILLGINMTYFIILALQYPSFALLGAGGFLFTIAANALSFIAFIAAILLFVITLACWKKITNHIWPLLPIIFYGFVIICTLIFNYFANMYGMYTFATYGEMTVAIIGTIVAIIAFMKYKKAVSPSIPVPAPITAPLT